MNREEFYKVIERLSEFEKSCLFYFLIGYFGEDKEFQNITLEYIEKQKTRAATRAMNN